MDNLTVEQRNAPELEDDKVCPYCHGTGSLPGPEGGEIPCHCYRREQISGSRQTRPGVASDSPAPHTKPAQQPGVDSA